jgi:hypothetical protein
MVERLTGAENCESNPEIGQWKNTICKTYADFEMIDTGPTCQMSAKYDRRSSEKRRISIRQSCVHSSDTELETPQDSSI